MIALSGVKINNRVLNEYYNNIVSLMKYISINISLGSWRLQQIELKGLLKIPRMLFEL